MRPDLARFFLPALDPAEILRENRMTPDPWQADFLRCPDRRILIGAHRQAGKSTSTAARGLWEAMYHPGALVLLLSPSQRQSAELLRKVKSLLPPFKERIRIASETALQLELGNGSRVLSLPGDPATIRGYSAPSLVIVDEAAQVKDILFDAITPMLAVSDGTLLLLSTPFTRRGFFYTEWERGGTDWTRFEIPVGRGSSRISETFLSRERARMGAKTFAQEYECRFGDSDEDRKNPRVFGTPDLRSALDSVFGGAA